MTPIAATLPAPTPPAQKQATSLRAVPEPASGDFRSRVEGAGVVVATPLTTGGLVVDLDAYVVTVDDQPVDVSPRQVELLALFLAEPRRVWSRQQLHWLCWGDTAPSRRVDVQLCRLRTKTGLDLFRNVRDRGWALRPLSTT